MSLECLFLINGLGLGNSTRCYAIICHLQERGVRVHVVTSQNGRFFFGEKPGLASLHIIENFNYSGGNGRVSAWKTMLALPGIYRIARSKSRQIAVILDQVKPDIVVSDSEYALGPVRKRKIPVVAINNSDVIVSEYLSRRDLPRSIAGQFWLIEFMDYLFHKFRCDIVISPSLVNVKPRHSRIRRVGPIVRREISAAVASSSAPSAPSKSSPLNNVVLMLSGSVFATEVDLSSCRFPFRIDVIGRSGKNTDCVTFHGKQVNNLEYLLRADVLVVNAGFSAVSEAAALQKPTLVLPVSGHAEQYINALMLVNCGLGYLETSESVLGRLQLFVNEGAWAGLEAVLPMLPCDGAVKAAEIIISMAEK